MKNLFIVFFLLLTSLSSSFAAVYQPKLTSKVIQALDFSVQQYKLMVTSLPDTTTYPRRTKSATDGTLVTVKAGDWTSGFFPGCLWYLYQYTGDVYWKTNALKWTGNLKSQKTNTNQGHDLGFVMNSSYGNAFRMTGDSAYVPILVESGQTLSNRFSAVVGCTKSWNSGSWATWSNNTGSWSFPVIIDNMMNLELLFKTSLFTNDSNFYKKACIHANTTLLNHIRPDSSTFHVVDYDNATGLVRARGTKQGLADGSCWSRGQAWGIYGFSMMYKFTRNSVYLNTAKKLLGYYLKNKPADHIPFWDYNVTTIPNTYRDASAAAITSSALIDLYISTNDSSYLIYAENIIQSLSTTAYTNALGTKANFILSHSTGGTNGYEPDVSQNYAEYYYIETLVKYLSLDANYQPANHIPEINTKQLESGTKGVFYSKQLDIFDFEGDNFIVSCSNLPAGLTINSSGFISGIPQNEGVYELNIRASDGKQENIKLLKLVVSASTAIADTYSNKGFHIIQQGDGNIVVNTDCGITYDKIFLNIFNTSGQLLLSQMSTHTQNFWHLVLPDNARNQLLIIEVSTDNNQFIRQKLVAN
ncbi:MAG: putative Ig domain-containing protein [Paludibacter sp.]